jgi:hypothetical protein
MVSARSAENRAEAFRASLKHAGARIKLIGEPGGRRWQRQAHQLADERGAELLKLLWKSLLK